MGVSLWLAFYLFGRGFPNLLSFKAVVLLVALSTFFASAYFNLFNPMAGTASLRAVLLVICLSLFLSIVGQLAREFALMPPTWIVPAVYAFGILAAFGLVTTRSAFVGEETNLLRVGRMSLGWPFTVYGIFQAATAMTTLYLLAGRSKFGFTPQGRYFLAAGIVSFLGVIYGVFSLAMPGDMPRAIQDALAFVAISLLGLAVARYQVLVERRTGFRDLPLSGIAVLGFASLAAVGALRLTASQPLAGIVFLFGVLVLSLHDLVREYMERRRRRAEVEFRQQLRQVGPAHLAAGAEAGLQPALELICEALDTSAAFLALRGPAAFEVVSAVGGLPPGAVFPTQPFLSDDLLRVDDAANLPGIVWLAPAFDGDRQVALLGVGPANSRLSYSPDDLDLLVEVADRIGPIVAVSRLRTGAAATPVSGQGGSSRVAAETDEVLGLLAAKPPRNFVKGVEKALRNLSDYITLGQMPLVAALDIPGGTHVERGKALRQRLVDAIAKLKPPGDRPREPLPREWYHYVILYDAYVEDVKNNEIMARLYISEGTFNRTRRIALRGLARLLIEQQGRSATSQ